MASEMDDEAERGSRTIGGLDGIAQADVVQLRAQSEVRKKTDIHAAAETIGKLVRRAAAGSSRQTRPDKQDLGKGSDLGGVGQRQTGADEGGVGVGGYAAGRGAVAAEVTVGTKPAVVFMVDRSYHSDLVDA